MTNRQTSLAAVGWVFLCLLLLGLALAAGHVPVADAPVAPQAKKARFL